MNPSIRKRIEHIHANETPAPFYLYNGQILREQAALLRQTFPDFSVLFSVKANPFPPILQKIASLGIGADAASAGEVALALDAGISAENIYYSAPAPTAEDIHAVWDKCHIIADSFHALALMEEKAAAEDKTIAVGVRLHPAFTMDGKPQGPSKFGIDEELLWAEGDLKKKYPHLSIRGLHIHIRSQVLDVMQLGKYYENVMGLAVRLQEFLGAPLEYINFGGGVGIAYDFSRQTPLNLAELQQLVSAAREKYADRLSARLLLESGRFLTCACGTYVTEIADIKHSHGKTYYVVKNASNGFFKPVLRQLFQPYLPESYGISFEPFLTDADDYAIEVLSASDETEIVDIAGHLCTGADVMAKEIRVKKAQIGDLIAFGNAGSYAYSLAPLLFASQPQPRQIYIDEA